ncbi:MAG TPA: hypothetical protein ACQGQH_10595 [Xylella sp.]
MEGIGYHSYSDPRLQPRELPEEVLWERVDAKVQAFLSDPDKIAEADAWAAGGLSAVHYNALETAMADLDAMPPDRLIGSALLERLYRLAKPHGQARLEHLHFLAQQEIQDEIQKENDRDHYSHCDARQEAYA